MCTLLSLLAHAPHPHLLLLNPFSRLRSTHSFLSSSTRVGLREKSVGGTIVRVISSSSSSSMENNNKKKKIPHELRLYNSRSKQDEIFKPLDENKVGMYFCGITPYDFSHIGHARAFVAADLIYRYLHLHLGYEVNFVRNFTDIDDKIITRANELGEDPLKLSERFSKEFVRDMNDLQCLPPTKEPRVSDHIDQVIEMIGEIIGNGHGYEVEGNVYFSIDSCPDYGKLSNRNQELDRDGARVEVDERKQNPKDFALWKAAKPGEPSWDSPWGVGRPGWHIECSAMSAEYLSHKFDIHGGGQDLEFPHHANEIAQSWAACPESNVGYWIHVGTVLLNGKKMSKSDGNFKTIRDCTETYHPLALRHFILTVKYRTVLRYTDEELQKSSRAVYDMYQTLQDCYDAVSPVRESLEVGTEEQNVREAVGLSSDAQICINKLREEFEARMSDDLDSSDVLKNVLNGALKEMNDCLKEDLKTLNKKQQKQRFKFLIELEKEVSKILDVLGLLSTTTSTYAEVLQQFNIKALAMAKLTEDDVLQLIQNRAEARKNKDFLTSDRIREKLNVADISLMDEGDDTSWRPTFEVKKKN